MESYELEVSQIIDWALFANYEELEEAAKALYSLYSERRKREHPEEHSKAKKYVRDFKRGGRK